MGTTDGCRTAFTRGRLGATPWLAGRVLAGRRRGARCGSAAAAHTDAPGRIGFVGAAQCSAVWQVDRSMQRRLTRPSTSLLGNWTEPGARDVKNTVKRSRAARETFAVLGVNAREWFLTLGQYDVVLTVDAPDDEHADACLFGAGDAGQSAHDDAGDGSHCRHAWLTRRVMPRRFDFGLCRRQVVHSRLLERLPGRVPGQPDG